MGEIENPGQSKIPAVDRRVEDVVSQDEMKLQDKTKERLMDELRRLRRRVSELEVLEIERRRTQEALKESENRTRALLNWP